MGCRRQLRRYYLIADDGLTEKCRRRRFFTARRAILLALCDYLPAERDPWLDHRSGLRRQIPPRQIAIETFEESHHRRYMIAE
jgi:hypothetical protein